MTGRVVAIAVAFVLVVSQAAHAAEVRPVTIQQITSRMAIQSGALVRFEGEAIGEALDAGSDRVWVNVLDGGVAIGVVVDRDAAAAISTWGSYRHTGDRVRVEGVYHVACSEHGGDMDVHATSLEVVAPGVERIERADPLELVVGLIGLTVAAGAWLGARARRLREEEY